MDVPYQSRKMVNNTTASACGLVDCVVAIIIMCPLLCCAGVKTYGTLLLELSSPALPLLLLRLALLQE
jgi:hypothetical protein